MIVSDRIRDVSVSASAAMAEKARDLRARGVKVISLSQGEPDFPTPAHAVEAAHAAAVAGDTKYPPLTGTQALKLAVQRKFKRDNGLDYELKEILVANGARQIVFDALMATCNPGDEVLVPTPGWISYADIAKVAGAIATPVACSAGDRFKLSPAALDAAITPRTKWLILNFPNNPTGVACSRTELAELADVLARHQHVFVLSDDIYEHLVYDGFEFCTLVQVAPALRDRVLTVNGASKAYAMTGWRVGYCAGPHLLIAAMSNVQFQSTSGISTVGQAAVAAVLDGPQSLLAERVAAYQERRDLVVDLLRRVPNLTCHKPEGAFYLFPDMSGCIGGISAGGQRIANDTDFVAALLEEKHVGVVPGAAYGTSGFFRVSYASDLETLREGCTRIQDFCEGLRHP